LIALSLNNTLIFGAAFDFMKSAGSTLTHWSERLSLT